jgi:hypothetical protein
MLLVVEIALENSALGMESFGETDEPTLPIIVECNDDSIVDFLMRSWCSFVPRARWNRLDYREV